MLALFWYSPIPYWASRNRDGQPAFFLDGETSEEMAWDLVEQFFDGFMTTEPFTRGKQGLVVVDALDLEPSLIRLQQYKDLRYGSQWWDYHIWRCESYWKDRGQKEIRLTHKSEQVILMTYLRVMHERYYLKHHGKLARAVCAEDYLEYFERNTYLRWVPLENQQLLSSVMAGDLKPLW